MNPLSGVVYQLSNNNPTIMNNKLIHCLNLVLMMLFTAFSGFAGTLSYVAIPATGSDPGSGISTNQTYTGAAHGNAAAGACAVNGVSLAPLAGSGDTITANNITLSSAGGALSVAPAAQAAQADGNLAQALTSGVLNTGADNNSEQYIVLEPSSLVAGKTYNLRVYLRKATDGNRSVNLTFSGDGLDAVSTDFFNEDDATTSPGGFDDPTQVYYINYQFKWDGATTPGVTILQRFGQTPFVFYAATNQEAAGAAVTPAAPPAVAPVAQPPPVQVQQTVQIQQPAQPVQVVSQQQTDVGISSNTFYADDSLKANGEWVVTSYGRCWRPTVVGPDWSPYTVGNWRYSEDEGWVWVSNEDWGWATYHYGRWIREEDAGWIWIPGRRWAPAWVSWRSGNSYTGWAPLPPDASFDDTTGISAWADSTYDIGPMNYNFVRTLDFGRDDMRSVVINKQENVNIIQKTTNITNIVNNNQKIYNGGPNYNNVNNVIKKHGGDTIPTVKIDKHGKDGALTADGKHSKLDKGVLSVTTPTIKPDGKKGNFKTDGKNLKNGKFDKGWNGVKDPTVTSSLKNKMNNETKGFTPSNTTATVPENIKNKGTLGSEQGQTTGKHGKHPGKLTNQGTVTGQQQLTQGTTGQQSTGSTKLHPGKLINQGNTGQQITGQQQGTQGQQVTGVHKLRPGLKIQQGNTSQQGQTQPTTGTPTSTTSTTATTGKKGHKGSQNLSTAAVTPVPTQGVTQQPTGVTGQQTATATASPTPTGKKGRKGSHNNNTVTATNQPTVTQGTSGSVTGQQTATATASPTPTGKKGRKGSHNNTVTAANEPTVTQGTPTGQSTGNTGTPTTTSTKSTKSKKHDLQSTGQTGTPTTTTTPTTHHTRNQNASTANTAGPQPTPALKHHQSSSQGQVQQQSQQPVHHAAQEQHVQRQPVVQQPTVTRSSGGKGKPTPTPRP